MKNSFSKKLMILAFAFGGLFMIGNNVFGNDPTTPVLDDPKDMWKPCCDPTQDKINCACSGYTYSYMKPKV